MPVHQRGLGAALGALSQSGCDLTLALAEFDSQIKTAAAGEMMEWTGLVEEIVDAVATAASSLVLSVTSRSAALGELDIARTPWLFRHGARPDSIRTALASEIGSGRGSTVELMAAIEKLRKPLGKRWQIREALVVRAMNAGASDPARPLLVEARKWDPVPRTKRTDYDGALTAIAAFGGLDDLITELREA